MILFHSLNNQHIQIHLVYLARYTWRLRWYFTDGSWKANDIFSGKSWFSTLEGFDGFTEAKNVRASLTPLHAEMETLLWAMECMKNLCQFQVMFANCSQLVKMVSELEECAVFCKLFGRY